MNLMTKRKTMKKLKSLMTTLKSKSGRRRNVGHLLSLKRLFGQKKLTRKSQPLLNSANRLKTHSRKLMLCYRQCCEG